MGRLRALYSELTTVVPRLFGRIHWRSHCASVVFAIFVFGLTACGGETTARREAMVVQPHGQAVFSKAGCGKCHSLAAAGSTGTIGPSLDGLSLDSALVGRQVRDGGRGMPAFAHRLSTADIKAVSSFVITYSARPVGKPSSFKPDNTTFAACKEKGSGLCWRQAFGNLAFTRGPKTALREFQQKMLSFRAVEADCHPIAHTIGAAALIYYKHDVGQAFAAGNGICGSGYYHGLLEWKLAGVPPSRVAAVARTACHSAEIRSSAFIYYQCDHGLGHGLMLYTRYDLPAALNLCHQLTTDFDQVSCTGGVFMENQQSSYGIRSRWLRKDNLLYPCDIVSKRDKLYCYLQVTSQILPNVRHDWRITADWCRRSEPDFVSLCFQSYGRDASGAAREDPDRIRELCAEADDGERECLFGAVRDVLNNNPSDLRARQLCESVSTSNRSYCFYGLGSILGTVEATNAGRRRACTRFASVSDRLDCTGGAASSRRIDT